MNQRIQRNLDLLHFSMQPWFRQLKPKAKQAFLDLHERHPETARQYKNYAERKQLPSEAYDLLFINFLHDLENAQTHKMREYLEEEEKTIKPVIETGYMYGPGTLGQGFLRHVPSSTNPLRLATPETIQNLVSAIEINLGVPPDYVLKWIEENHSQKKQLSKKEIEEMWEEIYARHIDTEAIRTAAKSILQRTGDKPFSLIHLQRSGIIPAKLIKKALEELGLKEGRDFTNTGVRSDRKRISNTAIIPEEDVQKVKASIRGIQHVVLVDSNAKDGLSLANLSSLIPDNIKRTILVHNRQFSDISINWIKSERNEELPNHMAYLSLIHGKSDVYGMNKDKTPRPGPMPRIIDRAIDRAFSRKE
ncbi:hypothetical protein HUU53_02455 [Candidatus Micrarchaeota archaeon]|nr:hypothetical protein [Candidatus Micrarchaeota archaeon]